MNRREALKQTSLLIGGALTSTTILAVWQGCKKTPSLGFEPQFFTSDQIHLISEMSEVIIPTTDTPGAIEAGVPEYIDQMIYIFGEEKEKIKFQEALDRFSTQMQTKYGKQYGDLADEEKIAEMTLLSEQDDIDDFNLFKRMQGLTTTGYFTSELVGETVLNYLPIPQEQIGCMPISELPNGRIWSP